MSVKKREGSPYYWCYFSINGQRIRESTGTANKEAAEQYEAKRKKDLWEQRQLGSKPRRKWQEAVVRWCRETKHKKSHRDDLGHLRWLDPHLRTLAIQDIDEDKLAEIVAAKLETGVSNATVNRVLAVVRSILRRAHQEWKWSDTVPTFRTLPEPKRRVRWLTDEEAAKLMAELPEHLLLLGEFTLEVGLRASNAAGLRWSQVDMPRRCAWVNADDAKGGEAIAIPLSDRAMEIIRSQIGQHIEFVFTYVAGKKHAPRPLSGQLSTRAWRKALKRAGITNFRWHDLRHTWASWHVQGGTPALALQELGGWSDMEMVRRYAHLNAEHLRMYAERGTKLTHSNVSEKNSSPKGAVSE